MASLFGGDPAAAKRRKAKRAAKQHLATLLASDTPPAVLTLRAASGYWTAAGASNTKATLPAKVAAAALLKTALPNDVLAQIWRVIRAVMAERISSDIATGTCPSDLRHRAWLARWLLVSSPPHCASALLRNWRRRCSTAA